KQSGRVVPIDQLTGRTPRTGWAASHPGKKLCLAHSCFAKHHNGFASVQYVALGDLDRGVVCVIPEGTVNHGSFVFFLMVMIGARLDGDDRRSALFAVQPMLEVQIS